MTSGHKRLNLPNMIKIRDMYSTASPTNDPALLLNSSLPIQYSTQHTYIQGVYLDLQREVLQLRRGLLGLEHGRGHL